MLFVDLFYNKFKKSCEIKMIFKEFKFFPYV